jgi:hypothetical protein
MYIKAHIIEEEEGKKFKKSPSQIKIEYLSKLFKQNQRGSTLNERKLNSPHPSLAKKLGVDHFRTRNMSVNSTTGLDFEND